MFQKSHPKIQITINTAHLIRINYPLSSFNYRLSGTNLVNFNKIHRTVSGQQPFTKWNLKTFTTNFLSLLFTLYHASCDWQDTHEYIGWPQSAIGISRLLPYLMPDERHSTDRHGSSTALLNRIETNRTEVIAPNRTYISRFISRTPGDADRVLGAWSAVHLIRTGVPWTQTACMLIWQDRRRSQSLQSLTDQLVASPCSLGWTL